MSENEETIAVDETTTTPAQENTSHPMVLLKDIEENVLIQDMNYEFFYTRIMQPDGNPSDLFNLNYREQSMERWVTCNGCLTQNFTIVKTEEAIRQIRSGLGADMAGEKHYRWDTTVKATFLLSGFELELPEDNEADILIFKLVTNVDADIEVLSRAALSFNVINSFSGNHALQLNYSFMKNIYGPEGDDQKILSSNNPFLLDNYTHRLIHDRSMAVSFEEIENIRNNVNDKINQFKQIPVVEAFIDDFASKFPKKFTRKFLALFEGLPSSFKNLYYASFIFGILIDIEKKINLEIKLRSFIKEYIKQVYEAATA